MECSKEPCVPLEKASLYPYPNSPPSEATLMMVSESAAFHTACFLGRAPIFTCVFLTPFLLLLARRKHEVLKGTGQQQPFASFGFVTSNYLKKEIFKS